MSKKKKSWKRIVNDIQNVLEADRKYELNKKEYIRLFTEDIGKYYCITYLSDLPEVTTNRFMHEFRNNLYYNALLHDFYDDLMDWYFHYYNGNTQPFLVYERMQQYEYTRETPIPTLEERTAEIYRELKKESFRFTDEELIEMAAEYALEDNEYSIESQREELAWIKKIKSHITPYVEEADFLPGIAYREIEMMAHELQICTKDILEMLISDVKKDNVKQVELRHRNSQNNEI